MANNITDVFLWSTMYVCFMCFLSLRAVHAHSASYLWYLCVFDTTSAFVWCI